MEDGGIQLRGMDDLSYREQRTSAMKNGGPQLWVMENLSYEDEGPQL